MLTDYIKDLDKFLETVEADALSFKPLGTKIHSYTRPTRGPRSSVGGASSSAPSAEDVIEYEVYHVCVHSIVGHNRLAYECDSLPGIRRASASTTAECSFLSFSTLKVVLIFRRKRTHGSLSSCKSPTTCSQDARSQFH
jgi:hypothetical protein